jgi:hypothetical protein
MRIRTLVVLAVVTVPTVALALLLPAPHGDTGTTAPSIGLLLPGLKGHVDALARIDITGASGTLALSRAPVPKHLADGWTLRDTGGYPVQAATIQPVIDGLVALHGVVPKTQRPKLFGRLDLGDAGKDSQSHLVALTDETGNALGSIVLGKQKPASGAGTTPRMYARVPGSEQAWLAAPSITLPAEKLDWLDRTVVDIDADQVREVVLTQPGNPPLDFSRAKAADKLDVRDVPAGRKLKSDTPGSDIQGAFSGLNFDDVKPDSQLGGSNAGSVHLVTFNGMLIDFTLRKDNGQTWATIAATGTADGAKAAQQIAARTKGWAYQIPSDKADTLLTSMAGLLEDAKK